MLLQEHCDSCWATPLSFPEHESSTKKLFKKASNGLVTVSLSQKYDNCVFIPMAKSFINGGKINEKYFRDGVHLTPEGSQMYADVLCKRLISLPVAKKH
jgi:hypothetical protein